VVLEAALKTWLYVAFGAFAGVVVATLVSVPFNAWYTANFVRGDNDVNALVSVLFFGFWPVGALVGGAIAYRLQKKR
jgi:hypothetical protein